VTLTRRRLLPRPASARLLLEAVSEVESIDGDALPPAHLAACALSAIETDAPWFAPSRVVVSVQGLGRAGRPTRVAGVVVPDGAGHLRAGARVVQRCGKVLTVEASGQERPAREDTARPVPGALAAYARAVGLASRYRTLRVWPFAFVVAVAAAGVEAENEGGLARLLRLSIDLVAEAPLEAAVRLGIDGVRPVSGDTARVVFRVNAGRRLVARGDALILSALARSAAMALGRAA
jgi:hypothetical protein